MAEYDASFPTAGKPAAVPAPPVPAPPSAAPPSVAARFGQLVFGASLLGVMYLLDRNGVLSTMKGRGPMSVSEIAAAAGLRTRLLEEALAAAAGAGFLAYADGKYELKDEAASVLVGEPADAFSAEVRETLSPPCLAGWAQMMQGVYNVLPALADSMRADGPPGVPFTAYGADFPSGLARMRAVTLKEWVPQRILPAMGLKPLLDAGVRCADVGCGAGLFSISLALHYPKCTVHGYDVDANSVSRARANLAKAPGASVEFEVRSVNDLQPVDGGFDVVFCFDMIHDLDDPLGGLRGIRRSLAPGGILVMMEPKRPERFEDSLTPDFAPLYGISSLHCVPQSLAGGGPGLGAAWGKKRAEELVLEAGFKGMEEREVNVPGFFQAMYVVKA